MSFNKKITSSSIESSAANTPQPSFPLSQALTSFSHVLGSRQVQAEEKSHIASIAQTTLSTSQAKPTEDRLILELKQQAVLALTALKRGKEEIQNPTLQKRARLDSFSSTNTQKESTQTLAPFPFRHAELSHPTLHTVKQVENSENIQESDPYNKKEVPISENPFDLQETIPETKYLEGVSKVTAYLGTRKKSYLECLNPENPLKKYAPFLASNNRLYIAFEFRLADQEISHDTLQDPALRNAALSDSVLKRVNMIIHGFGKREFSCTITDFVGQAPKGQPLKVSNVFYRKNNTVSAEVSFITSRTSSRSKDLVSIYVGNHRLLDRAFTLNTKNSKIPSTYEGICQHVIKSNKGILPLLVMAQRENTIKGYETFQEFRQKRLYEHAIGIAP